MAGWLPLTVFVLFCAGSSSAASISMHIQLETKPLFGSVSLTPYDFTTTTGAGESAGIAAGFPATNTASWDIDPPAGVAVIDGFAAAVPHTTNSYSGFEYYASYAELRIEDTIHFMGDLSNGPVSGSLELHFNASMTPNASYEADYNAATGSTFNTGRLFASLSATSDAGGSPSLSASDTDFLSTDCGGLIPDCGNIVSDAANPALAVFFTVDDANRDVDLSTLQFGRVVDGATFTFDPVVSVNVDEGGEGLTYSADGGYFVLPEPDVATAFTWLAGGLGAIAAVARRRHRLRRRRIPCQSFASPNRSSIFLRHRYATWYPMPR